MSYDESQFFGSCPNNDGGSLVVVGAGVFFLRCPVCACQWQPMPDGTLRLGPTAVSVVDLNFKPVVKQAYAVTYDPQFEEDFGDD